MKKIKVVFKMKNEMLKSHIHFRNLLFLAEKRKKAFVMLVACSTRLTC